MNAPMRTPATSKTSQDLSGLSLPGPDVSAVEGGPGRVRGRDAVDGRDDDALDRAARAEAAAR